MKNDIDTVRVLLNLKVDINATNVSKEGKVDRLMQDLYSD